MHVLDLFAETSLEEEAAFLAKQSMKEAAGVGVVKGGKDPRYMTATMGNQNDVTGSTLGKEMKAYFPTKPPKIQHQKQIKNSVAETADVTDYNPPSQGGTRRELVAKYHQTKDPKDAEAARRAGATQQELQGVAEGKWFRTTYGWAGGEKPGGGKYKHPETVAAERRAKLAAKKKAEQAAKFGKSDAEPGVAEGLGGGYPATPKYKVGDTVCVRGYQGVGKIAFIKSRSDVGVIFSEPEKGLRVRTTIDKLLPKQGVAEGTIPEDMFRTKAEVENPVDSVKLDIPLLIRIMEYAREDAKTDLDLHDIAERLISISRSGNTLSMRDYDRIVGKEARPMLTNRH